MWCDGDSCYSSPIVFLVLCAPLWIYIIIKYQVSDVGSINTLLKQEVLTCCFINRNSGNHLTQNESCILNISSSCSVSLIDLSGVNDATGVQLRLPSPGLCG